MPRVTYAGAFLTAPGGYPSGRSWAPGAAVRIVADTRRCSTSWLQRKLGLGYNRAARIVETMERRGLVGPANGSKDREVLIDTI